MEPKKTALVVEDDHANQVLILAQMKKLGIHALLASNGKEAIEQFKAHNDIALILMDCMMPFMDGFETTRAIRDIEDSAFRTPIIAFTAMTDSNYRAANMDDCLQKPYSLAMLKAVINRWMQIDM